MSENNKMKLSPPWQTFYREVEALFGDDPDIKIVYDEKDYLIKLYVNGQDKADALGTLLPEIVEFGNVKVTVKVIPNNESLQRKEDIIRKAFAGNPAFSYAVTAEGIFTNPITYVVFKPEIVQYWNDDLHSISGKVTTLYENLAENIIGGDDGVFFCTDELDKN